MITNMIEMSKTTWPPECHREITHSFCCQLSHVKYAALPSLQ